MVPRLGSSEAQHSALEKVFTAAAWVYYGCAVASIYVIVGELLPEQLGTFLGVGNLVVLSSLAGFAPQWKPCFVGDVDSFAALLMFPLLTLVTITGTSLLLSFLPRNDG